VHPVSGKVYRALYLLYLSGIPPLKCQNIDHIDLKTGRLPETGSFHIPIILKLQAVLMHLLGCIFAYIN
jgi:hypothetical protein